MTPTNDKGGANALNSPEQETGMAGETDMKIERERKQFIEWLRLHRVSEEAISKWTEATDDGDMARPIVEGNTIRVARPIGDASMEGNPFAENRLFMPGMLQEFLSERQGEAVTLTFNTPGGSSFSGRECAAMLDAHEGETTAQITALAASAGAIMAQACDKVEIYEGAMAMIHPPSTFAFGNSNELMAQADMLKKLEGSAVKILSRRMGEEFVRECFEKGDAWFDSEDCMSNKFADAIMDMGKKDEEMGDKDDEKGESEQANDGLPDEETQARFAEESRKTDQALIALACA